jgi:signal transduction histidine kinase
VPDRAHALQVTTAAEATEQVVMSIADSGVGIDPKNAERMFEPFFTTKARGMGMGLSICRSIIEAHGGRLWMTPAAPHGSVFHVRLPTAGEP